MKTLEQTPLFFLVILLILISSPIQAAQFIPQSQCKCLSSTPPPKFHSEKPTHSVSKTKIPLFQRLLLKILSPKRKENARKSRKLAIASLVLGASSIAFIFVPIISLIGIATALAAIILGSLALRRLPLDHFYSRKNKRMAIAGIILGSIFTVAVALFFVFVFFIFLR